jgi:hypothetical protein
MLALEAFETKLFLIEDILVQKCKKISYSSATMLIVTSELNL